MRMLHPTATTVNLFLSYPSAERTIADRLRLALEAEGHEVFFDRSDLDAGQSFHERLRKEIQSADVMIFLITPASVAPGSYTLAELGIAQERWRRPAGHVLPVMIAPTPMASLPPYLSAVTVLQPTGELVADTVAAVAKLGGRGSGATPAHRDRGHHRPGGRRCRWVRHRADRPASRRGGRHDARSRRGNRSDAALQRLL